MRLDGISVTGPDDARILTLVENLEADGGTDLESGLRFGYELATTHYDPERLSIAAEDVVSTTIGQMLSAPGYGLTRGEAIVATAEALAAIARHDAEREARVATARTRVDEALRRDDNVDLEELREMLDLAAPPAP